MKKALLLAVSALWLSACAQDTSSAPASSERGANSQARSVAFKTLGGDMKEIGDVLQGNSTYDVEKFKIKATEFAAHAAEPFKHMAQDGNGGDGYAKPEVWSNATAYQAEQDKFLQAVEAFNSAAQTGNLESIKMSFGAVGGSCKSCHDSFKLSQQ